MVRPSQSLLFRPIPALQKIFSPPAPLPLEPRDSKRLLNLLTTSFRQQLEREHELTFRVNDVEDKPHVFQKSHKPEKTPRRRLSMGQSELRATDRHLQSVLTNPLFSHGPENTAGVVKTRDPMETFDRAVAKGLMKIQHAKGCLDAKKRQITESSDLSIRESMRMSGAGLKVLKWLTASGVANNNDFLFEDKFFRKLLLEFMVAEDLQEVAWVWMQRELNTFREKYESSPEALIDARRRSAKLLRAIVEAELAGCASLDKAFDCVSMAASYTQDKNASQIIFSAANLLTQRTSFKTHTPPSLSSFDSYIKLVIPQLDHRRADFQRARLYLHHPSRPTAAPALDFFRRNVDRALKPLDPEVWTRRCIMLGIDASNHLLEHEKHNDAKWLMGRLQLDYAEELGISRRRFKKTITREIDDALNVNSLASLDLA